MTIKCEGIDRRTTDRLNELLDMKDLELKEKIAEANEWTRKYHELMTAAAGDPELQELIREGKFEQAGEIIDQRIAAQEAVIEALAANHFQRAVVFSLQFKPREAFSHYQKAYQHQPENRRYALEYALALRNQNQFEESENVYRGLLARVRALALEARNSYRKLAKANPQVYRPDLARSLNNLRVLYLETDREAQAMEIAAELQKIERQKGEPEGSNSQVEAAH